MCRKTIQSSALRRWWSMLQAHVRLRGTGCWKRAGICPHTESGTAESPQPPASETISTLLWSIQKYWIQRNKKTISPQGHEDTKIYTPLSSRPEQASAAGLYAVCAEPGSLGKPLKPLLNLLKKRSRVKPGNLVVQTGRAAMKIDSVRFSTIARIMFLSKIPHVKNFCKFVLNHILGFGNHV